MLGASIWIFQGPQKAKQTLAAAKAAVKELPRDMLPWTTLWLPILALYTPVHIFNFVLASSFALVPASYAAAFWVGTLVLYYALTSQDCPQHTGEVGRPAAFSALRASRCAARVTSIPGCRCEGVALDEGLAGPHTGPCTARLAGQPRGGVRRLAALSGGHALHFWVFAARAVPHRCAAPHGGVGSEGKPRV